MDATGGRRLRKKNRMIAELGMGISFRLSLRSAGIDDGSLIHCVFRLPLSSVCVRYGTSLRMLQGLPMIGDLMTT